MNVGQRIREVRQDLGMPGAVLARRVGVAKNHIWQLERGGRTPSLGLLEKIAQELRVEPAELLREESVPLAAATTRVAKSAELRWRVLDDAVDLLLDDPQGFSEWSRGNPEKAKELALLVHAS